MHFELVCQASQAFADLGRILQRVFCADAYGDEAHKD